MKKADLAVLQQCSPHNWHRNIVRLHVVSDGVEAMSFLNHEGPHAEAPRPVLILLDLNLPKMDGREVLARIKGDPSLKTIPIAILTTSELQANCYLTKPVRLEEFETLVRSVNDFWLTKVKFLEGTKT